MRPFLVFVLFLFLTSGGLPVEAADLPRRDGVDAESYPSLDTIYGELPVGDGTVLRTILTRPRGLERPPVVLFVQWLSCDTIEVSADRQDGWSQMLRGIIRGSGWAVMRTEKRGVGDSSGGPCSELDYKTELADHRAALAALSRRDDIDARRIVVFGASMGSRMAPEVAADNPAVVGVLGWGGGSKTWFERMQAFDRNALELGDTDPEEVAMRMREQLLFYTLYLLEGQDPPDIIAADPAMAGVWTNIIGTSADAHYGRSFAFHQQAQQADWTSAWSRIKVPVLVVMGEYDWFENQAGHETVVRIVNRQKKGRAEFRVVPQMDHHFTIFPDARSAFLDEGGQGDAKPFLDLALPWLQARQ